MVIGLIDEDWVSRKKLTFPNLGLMKLASYHRNRGDIVGWYEDILGTYDRVYCSRVFSAEYTKPYDRPINAHEVVRGGVRLCDLRWPGWPGVLRRIQGPFPVT